MTSAAAPISPEQRSAESRKIQVLRGLACLLIISMHVIGTRSFTGLRVDDDSEWRQFARLLMHFQLPLFSFLSGLAYAYRPIVVGQALTFLQKKVLRLVLPLLAVTTLYFICEMLMPNPALPRSLANMWQVYVLPVYHTWFLTATMLIFVVAVALERLGALRTLAGFLVTLAVVLLLRFNVKWQPDYFSVIGALTLLPFFLLGIAANRFRQVIQHPVVLIAATCLFVPLMGAHWLGVLGIAGHPVPRDTVLSVAISFTAVLTLWRWFPYQAWLERIGDSSFSIYLYHVFFVAGSRMLLQALGVEDRPILFVAGIVCGIIGPLFAEQIIRSIPIGRRVLLGGM
jgi:peptidoglycan/LPS O-acetylase OafA/YrhL